MFKDEKLIILKKVCGGATVVPILMDRWYRIYLGNIIVNDPLYPPQEIIGGGPECSRYWTVDGSTINEVADRAFTKLYDELERWCMK